MRRECCVKKIFIIVLLSAPVFIGDIMAMDPQKVAMKFMMQAFKAPDEQRKNLFCPLGDNVKNNLLKELTVLEKQNLMPPYSQELFTTCWIILAPKIDERWYRWQIDLFYRFQAMKNTRYLNRYMQKKTPWIKNPLDIFFDANKDMFPKHHVYKWAKLMFNAREPEKFILFIDGLRADILNIEEQTRPKRDALKNSITNVLTKHAEKNKRNALVTITPESQI
jgi:hypothetical protein